MAVTETTTHLMLIALWDGGRRAATCVACAWAHTGQFNQLNVAFKNAHTTEGATK